MFSHEAGVGGGVVGLRSVGAGCGDPAGEVEGFCAESPWVLDSAARLAVF